MLKLLLDDSTNIKIMFGKSINSAHKHYDFPQGLSLKINVVNRLIEALKSIGKEVELEYISKINYGIV